MTEDDSPALDTALFEFKDLVRPAFEDVMLSNIERQQLRVLAEPGGPLHRIMQGLLGYKSQIEQALGSVDLFASDGLAKAAALQAEVKAIIWQYGMWQRLLTFVPAETEDEGS